jgi:hypothetical protein
LLGVAIRRPQFFSATRLGSGERVAKALEDCKQAIALHPKETKFIETCAFVRFRLEQFDLAIADYDAVLRVNAKSASALCGRGLMKRRTGDKPGGD